MKALMLHICCGPCAIYPVEALRDEGWEIKGLFYNPNIHPFLEFERRVEALREISQVMGFEVRFHPQGYGLEEWLKNVWLRAKEPPQRCHLCYEIRLRETARIAREQRLKYFSTTLLYSIYQHHDYIKDLGKEIGRAFGLEFYYLDFRKGWKRGKDEARQIGIYTQPYCGCILSEKERYIKRIERMNKKLLEEAKAL